MERQFSTLLEIAQALDTSANNLQGKVADLVAELSEERRQVLAMQRELAKKEAESLLDKTEVVNGVKLLVARVSYSRMEIMRETSDFIRNRLKSAVVVLGGIYGDKPTFLAAVTPDLVDRGYDAGKIVKEVAKVAGGGGGGKATLAQAGGKYKDKLDEALKLVKGLI